MKSARTLLKDYRKAGRSDAEIRALAADQPEAVRERLLAYLEEETGTQAEAPAKRRATRRRRPDAQTGVLIETEKISADQIPDTQLPGDGLHLDSDLPPEQLFPAPETPALLPAAPANEPAATEPAPVQEPDEAQVRELTEIFADFDRAPEVPSPEEESVLAGIENELAQDEARTITLVIEDCIELNLAQEELQQPAEVAAELTAPAPEQEVAEESGAASITPATHAAEIAEVVWRSGMTEELARNLSEDPYLVIDPRTLAQNMLAHLEQETSFFTEEAEEEDTPVEQLVDELVSSFTGDSAEDDAEEEDLPQMYLPPELTVIDCAAQAEPADPQILQFQPGYALTPQQRAEALERAENDAYYEMARAIEADFQAMAQGLRAETPELVCTDFDDIARPAEPEWAPEPVLVTLEEDSAEEAQAREKTEEELQRLRGWLNELEDGLKMKRIEQGKLMQELHERDETLVAMGRQLENATAVQAALREQSEADSIALARETNLLGEQRARLQELHHENELLHRELERLTGCLTSNNTIVAAQAEQASRLREQIDEMNRGIGGLLSHNRQVEAVLAQREKELDNLRLRLRQQNEMLLQHADERHANERLAAKFEDLQRDYNILINETVPNLQADKEELVCLVGEESARSEEFELLAARRARRLSYSTVIAAAACLFVVLSPLLAWHNQQVDRLNFETATTTKLAQAESVRDALHAERNNLRVQLEAVRAEFGQAREQWNAKLAQLTTPQNAAVIEAVANARTVDTSAGPVDPTTFDLAAQESPVATASGGENDKTHYNGVAGVDVWRVTQNLKGSADTTAEAKPEPRSVETAKAATDTSGKKDNVPATEEKFNVVQVRKGEGLSQVLWRVYGNSSPEMVKNITKLNNLPVDKKGHPMLKLDQELRLPANPRTAMVTD